MSTETQWRSEDRWRPGLGARLASPCSNVRFFGSKCTELKKVLVTLLGLFGASQWFSARRIVSPFPIRYDPAETLAHQLHSQRFGRTENVQLRDLTALTPRPVTSLGHQGGRRVVWECSNFVKLCPILSNYVQHIFQAGRGGFVPLASPWLRACLRHQPIINTRTVISTSRQWLIKHDNTRFTPARTKWRHHIF